MGKVTSAERRWVFLFAVIVMAITTIPYAIGYAAQGKDTVFSGFLWGVQDGESYIAKMREGADGAWLFRLRYTTEPQSGALIFLPYLWLGKLAGGAALHEQLVALFHLARIAAGVASIIAAYYFLALFVEETGVRKWALALACLGGGFGWIMALGGRVSLEYFSPETFSFLELFGLPHLAAARSLLLVGIILYLSPATQRLPWRRGLAIGMVLIGAWFFQPLAVPIAWSVMGAHLALLFLRDQDKRTFFGRPIGRQYGAKMWMAVAVSLPAFLYSALAFNLDPALRAWTAGNQVLSPEPWQYLSAYGLLILPALAAAVLMRRDERALLPIGWILLLPVFLYVPIGLQRRLADGAWLALVALAAMWAEKMLPRRLWKFSLPAMLGASMATFALVVAGSLSVAARPEAPAFLPLDEVRAFQWLDAHSAVGESVLTDFEAGNALPAFTHLTAYLGHGVETLLLSDKMKAMGIVFDSAKLDAERIEALRQAGTKYVLMGPQEAFASGGRLPGCKRLISMGAWSVWLVEPPLP
jgi:hypothetical protein